MKPDRKPNVLVAAVDVAIMVAVEAVAAVAIVAAVVAVVDAVATAEIAAIAVTAGSTFSFCSFLFRASGHSPMRPKHNFQPAESF
jgi:hypothetical protein